MKNAVVRARIDSQLKEQAVVVLEANGLDLSDAIRLFLNEVVRRRAVPFPVRDPSVRVVSGKHLWAMKRAAQARHRELVERGEVPPGGSLMFPSEVIKSARIEWPDDSALDE